MLLQPGFSDRKNIRIAVIGIGYVGLPLAVRLAEKDFQVIGVDVKETTMNILSRGESTIEGLTGDQITNVLNTKKTLSLLQVHEEPRQNGEKEIEALAGVHVFVICVPTPLHQERLRDPETSSISNSATLIDMVCEYEERNGRLPKERLIVLESTTYPGTTKNLLGPIRDRLTGQGVDCFLAYSPERTSPGQRVDSEKEDAVSPDDTFQIPRIVGGIDDRSRDLALDFYKTIFNEVVPVSDLETAEMVKLVENTFRFVSIGFANEIGRIAREFGLDIWEIIYAAKTKPFGLDLCYPGLVGGHCLPIDPHYLAWVYRNRRNVATFVETAEQSHQDTKRDALDLIHRVLTKNEKGFMKAKILFLGVAYKRNVADIRESGVLDLIRKVFSLGAEVSFWDPMRSPDISEQINLTFTPSEIEYMPESSRRQLVPSGSRKFKVPVPEFPEDWSLLGPQIRDGKFDCIVVGADHDKFWEIYPDLISASIPIVDLNNGVGNWLAKKLLPAEKIDPVQDRLKDRRKYVLLGRD